MCLRVVFALLFGSSGPLLAQQMIQQPVVSTTGVRTTVSVPDRGNAFLGGVSSAQSQRNRSGPFRSGSSLGFARQNTSISTGVYIHDLQAMDEAILNSAPSNIHKNQIPHPTLKEARDDRRSTSPPSPVTNFIRSEQLAQRAEAAGKWGVAKLHWQAAARHGSKLAETRLAELP
ncbi:MAG: hypothetical protein DWI02_10310 [Planctomycetota bacterium]|jgi:hypothetical protein|nr:MAG: hypothetical protein DWI02_10310 [Planctomycetota bacterium]